MNSATRHVMKMGNIRRYDEKLMAIVRSMSADMHAALHIPMHFLDQDRLDEGVEAVVKSLQEPGAGLGEFLATSIFSLQFDKRINPANRVTFEIKD